MKSNFASGALSFFFVFAPAHSQSMINSANQHSPASPAASTPSYWLILGYHNIYGSSLEKVQMQTIEQCESQGAIWGSSKRILSGGGSTGFECLEGK